MSGIASGAGPSGFAPRVRAVLGPTNTGKTHLAIERLLAHHSGIIGFPLRLLARENYDRMVARKGVRNVALITGEEKIVPPEARWFSCTVEAMPLDRRVEFLAVDEIQLCADPDRGHIFTDRLLHARGLTETMFLGAETIRRLLQRLVPQAEVETRPRLSQLVHAGPAKLVKLPPRSAVVAFSAGEVYAIAEAIRRRRGGCAVVMGRLSPRTRNAQVALYQDKEVDFLVATDAIGMGLNMDVDHVAFAGLSKFDGHRPRALTPAELGQIAGRAGRGMRDGTFGTTADCPPLPEPSVAAIEAHSFEPLGQLAWRNSDLDFSGVDALLASLAEPPPGPGLARGNDASDQETLAALAREPEIRRIAQGRGAVRLLWDACQIPDFRKLADETHTRLCGRIFTHLANARRLPCDFLAGQIATLDRVEGDIDTLMQRLAGIRVWSYIAARADWVTDAPTWQEAARAVEDRLSDALHQRLLARFVDRRAAHLVRKLAEGEDQELLSAVTRRGEVVVEGHAVGHVAGFAFVPDPMAEGEERKLVLRAARRALRTEMSARVARLEAAPDGAFSLDNAHRLHWDGAPVARLTRGETRLRPRVAVRGSEFLDGAARERVRVRLQRFVDETVRADLAPLFAAAGFAAQSGAVAGALRGPLHMLTEALGVVPGATEETVGPELRGKLKPIGVRAGRYALFMPALLKPRAMAMRARLLAVWEGVPMPALPDAGLVSIPPAPGGWPAGMADALGWLDAGPARLRIDVAERVAAELGWATRRGASALPAGLAGRFALRTDMLPAVLRKLGFRLVPASVLAADQFGPPAPAMLLPPRRRRATLAVAEAEPAVVASGPFAALAALRR
ncbi:MAG: DNA helicase [Proteobacteria bacterium]|nr:DNA helicase [Pseudomonadota bacterium]